MIELPGPPAKNSGRAAWNLSHREFARLPFIATTDPTVSVPAAIRVWHDYPEFKVHIMDGIDWALSVGADVINLSIEILERFDPNDPLCQAITYAANDEKVVVVAAGNRGPRPGTLSQLAQSPDAIAVGATTSDRHLLETSSRGFVNGAGPLVVSDGTDYMEDPFSPGTSFAAPRVAQVILFLHGLIHWLTLDLPIAREGGKWGAQPPRRRRLAILDTGIKDDTSDSGWINFAFRGDLSDYVGARRIALSGELLALAQEDPALHFNVDSRLQTIRRLLAAVADPADCSDPLGCGAGYVDLQSAASAMTRFDARSFIDVFGESDLDHVEPPSLRRLETVATKYGPFWEPSTIEWAADRFGRQFELYVGKVWTAR